MEQRALKFRAWHPEWEDMLLTEYSSRFEKREFYPFEFMVGFSHYPQDDGWILMLYTGLNDKNGNPIYEGDILKKNYGSSTPVFIVAWNLERAMFIAKDGYNQPLFEFPLNMIEVIGNIYQNPELIQSL